MTDSRPEAWLCGPVADIPALPQPVAHALLHAADEVEELLQGLPARGFGLVRTASRLWASIFSTCAAWLTDFSLHLR
jgi:hypothetical protein